jgi:hypothetical protein
VRRIAGEGGGSRIGALGLWRADSKGRHPTAASSWRDDLSTPERYDMLCSPWEFEKTYHSIVSPSYCRETSVTCNCNDIIMFILQLGITKIYVRSMEEQKEKGYRNLL